MRLLFPAHRGRNILTPRVKQRGHCLMLHPQLLALPPAERERRRNELLGNVGAEHMKRSHKILHPVMPHDPANPHLSKRIGHQRNRRNTSAKAKDRGMVTVGNIQRGTLMDAHRRIRVQNRYHCCRGFHGCGNQFMRLVVTGAPALRRWVAHMPQEDRRQPILGVNLV